MRQKNIPAKELRSSSSSEDETTVKLLVVRFGGPTSVFRNGLWVQYATTILQVGFMLPKRFLLFLQKNNLHQNHVFLHATPSGPSMLVMVPRVWRRPVIAGLESSEKVHILRCLLLSALLFPFLFFLSSPNSVSTLRGSYGCKGRCLIRVLTQVSSILPVNFHVEHILPQSSYVPPIVIYTCAMYLLPIYYLCTLTTLHVLNIYRTYHTFQ